tara:strand:- start:398 stop:577 length:180 start_codon:yes stop_codon:yes gene_type:complete
VLLVLLALMLAQVGLVEILLGQMEQTRLLVLAEVAELVLYTLLADTAQVGLAEVHLVGT